MIGSRAWRALLRRDLIYRRRNIVGSLFELLLPIIFVGFLVLIKNSVEDSESFAPTEYPDFFPANSDALISFSFRDYVTTLQADRKCVSSPNIPWRSSDDGDDSGLSITGIFNKGYNWQVPFVKCDSRLCEVDGEDAFPYCEFLALGVAPSSPDDAIGLEQARAFRDYVNDRYPVLLDEDAMPFDFDFVQLFDSDQAIDQFVQSPEYGDELKLALAIVFDGTDAEIDYNYKLRVNSTGFNSPEDAARPATTTTPPTDKKFEMFARTDGESCPDIVGGAPDMGPYTPSCTGRYIYNGALTIQRLVNDFIISESGASDNGYYVAENGVQFVAFPYESFIENGFYAQINAFAPLLITLGLLYPVAAMIRYIVLEKELRQKELMKMMSVKESDIGWSWFIFFFLFHVVTAIGAALVSTQLYSASSPVLLFIFWLFTFLAIICFSMFLASLFSRATRATLVSLLVFFVGYFLTLIADYQTSSVGVIFLISLHPVGAFAFGLQEIGRLEDFGVGLTFESISTTDSPNGYTFANTMSSFLFDSLLWGVMSWYLNRVARSEYGVPLPWYFPFTLSYWCPGTARAPEEDYSEITYPDDVPVEPVSTAMKEQVAHGKGIEVRNLTKVFGDKTAVDNFSMDMFSDQITCLLGRNGAGKTTTISMLTGMLDPTSGYAKLGGKDIRTEMDNIRGGIGICLQHNCLFPQLTVREHVSFFARIKGLYAKVSRAEAEQKIETSIKDVALGEKSNTLSKNLSGGMKRKLSVAIAFCGDSSTVLLDEPTSGMDPFSRRFTWNVLREYRKDRTIILTTHFMDEADILGDRIAIMAEGQLRCLGSSLFLKKTYGVGYQLTIEKQPTNTKLQSNAEDDGKSVKDTAAMDKKLEKIVKGAVSEATLLTNVGTEMTYQLPIGASSSFMPMFDQLDDEVSKEDIVTYGVSITTLDEVFLLVARGVTQDKPRLKSAEEAENSTVPYKDDAERSARSKMDLETEGLFVRHVGALFRKRAMNFKRDKKAWCCTTILPSVFVLIGFLLYAFVSPTRDLDPLVMDLNDYNVDVTAEPRNPITFSDGEAYSCQPGKCIYEFPVVALNVTNELYYYCGTQSYIGNGTSCSLESYESTIGQITEAGAEPVAATASTVNESSYSLFDSASAFAATQYGGIFYRHDTSSIVSEVEDSTSLFNLYFSNFSFGDIDLATLGPFLETAGINISEIDIDALLNAAQEIEGVVDNLFPGNIDVDGLPYSEAVIGVCLDRIGNYTTQANCVDFDGIGYVIQYNFTALHVAPLYQTLADEALVREATGNSDFKIQTTMHPLPITSDEASVGAADDAFIAWFLIILSFPFIAGSFATFVVAERESKAKHLQTVAGVKPWSYWLSSWLWDVTNYQIPCWITVALMFVFSVDIMTTSEGGTFGGVLTLLILFGPAAASFSYLISFLFKSPSICNLFIIIFSFLIAFGGTLATFILRLIGADPANPRESLTLAAEIVEWVLRFCPAFCLGRGLYAAINLQSISFLEGRQLTVWDEAACLYEVIFLGWETVVYLILAMKIDEWSANPRAVSIWKGFLKIISCQWICDNSYDYSAPENTSQTTVDDDVEAEEQRVLTGGANDDLIVMSQLTKIYDTGKKAVDSLSLGIPPGQCFGLLGVNGAGKTTTMGMLTAEFPPTSGDATLAGYSVTKEPEKTRRRVGYCPQFDALFSNLTGREHVELYASIKGVPPSLVKEASASKLAEVGLSESDSDRLAAGYSGGMKRRLSLATATIGNPGIVFLDECSTGVDPVARREIWAMISNMVSGGNVPPEERTSVILTTHSMEDCEALCPRIGIMAGGRLRCLGSAQRLKSKFGQGYQVELKVKHVEVTDEDYLKNLSSFAKVAGVAAPGEDADMGVYEQTFLDLNKTTTALQELSGDDFLSSKLNENDPVGYVVFKEAGSPTGIDLCGLAEFATTELRMRLLQEFISENYPDNVLRERQDTKARYEVGSKDVQIGNIFASIEENKDRLMVSEYGVSQTSLEQVFNIFAAQAESEKQGTADR